MRKQLLSMLILLCLTVSNAWADGATVTFTGSNNHSINRYNITLPHTFSCNSNKTGELDQVVKDIYGNISGTCVSIEYHSGGAGNLSVSGSGLTISGNFSDAEVGCRYIAQTGPNPEDVVNNVYTLNISVTGAPAQTSGSWTSGDCTVTLDNGVLTVSKTNPASATGNMGDYNPPTLPWQGASTGITSIVIENGVTHIGDFAFYGCNNASLTSVSIPASVTSIGSCAFMACGSLATVTLNSNPSIGNGAFVGIRNGATVTMNLTGNEGATGQYWTTFYNQNYNFQVPSTTQIFKAALSGSTLTLTELTTDKIVNADNAVILKSTTGHLALTLTTTDSSNDFTSNSLQGVSNVQGLEAANPSTTYVLNKTATNGVGFYKLTAGKKLGVGKAYLTYSASAREFFGFEETTTIETTNREPLTNNQYYDLQGRRVAQPTRSATTGDASTVGLKKGLYIVNGKKVVIK